jgi:hypothetical protein
MSTLLYNNCKITGQATKIRIKARQLPRVGATFMKLQPCRSRILYVQAPAGYRKLLFNVKCVSTSVLTGEPALSRAQ